MSFPPAGVDASMLCQACGACCAFSPDWPRFSLESDADLARIPDALIDPSLGRMAFEGGRCKGLAGKVGEHVACGIYADRPIVCRDCMPGDEECLTARAHHGLS